MTQEELRALVARVKYLQSEEGISLREVSSRIGMSCTTLTQRLREAGAKPRVLKPLTQEMLAEAERLLVKERLSMNVIARRLGVGRTRLAEHLQEFRRRKREP